ncbi:restriction endonuclease subunit S, partial [Accumulibacter sp.]|uniref:restriction endonuclease subunit S n=1 Tax=Accumulibacter sp. TaxID=2053492 RepID=UPI002BC2B4A7
MTWATTEFQSLFAEPSRNGVYKSKEHHGSGFKVINMGELFRHDRIGCQEMARLQMTDRELLKAAVVDGDLLFGRRSLVEEGAGRCALAWGIEEPTVFESSIIRVRLSHAVADPLFYFYYFRSPVGRARIRSIVGGATVKGIRGSDLQRIEVDQPPLDIQERIASRLRHFDDLIEANRRRIALLEESAQLLYREWFVNLRFRGYELLRLVDGLPEKWRVTTYGDIVDAIGGATPSTKRLDYWNGDVVWLTPTDVTRNDCLYLSDSARRITETGYESCSTKLLPPGTIFMTSRASIGYFALLDQPACTNQGFIAVVPKLRNCRNYLLFNLMNRVDEFNAKATGSTFKELSRPLTARCHISGFSGLRQ